MHPIETETSHVAEGPPNGVNGHRVVARPMLLLILAAGAFTTALNVTLLSPLIVAIADEFDVSEASAGQLATLTAAASGLTALIVAPWMDRYPRRAWLRAECVLLAVGSIFSALAPTFGWMFAARMLAGIGAAVIGANCLAACADLYTDPRERNRALGIINTAFTLGAVFGLPLVTLLAAQFSWRVAVAAPAPLAAIVFAGTFLLPRSVPIAGVGSLWTAWKSGYRHVLSSRQTVWILAAEILFMVVWFGWLIYFGAFTEEVFALSATALSVVFLAGGFAEVIGNNLGPYLLRTRSILRVAVAAVVISTINLLLVGVAYTEEWTLIPFICIGSGVGAVLFICVSIALLDSLPSARGAVMSLQSASLEMGGALGVALTGAALASLDDYEAVYRLLGLVMPLVALCLVMSARHRAGGEAPTPTSV